MESLEIRLLEIQKYWLVSVDQHRKKDMAPESRWHFSQWQNFYWAPQIQKIVGLALGVKTQN